MSTEAHLTTRFLRTLRQVPEAVVTKYNDRVTSGIPDASVTHKGRTVWMEFKAWPKGYTGTIYTLLRRTNSRSALQLHMLWRYHVASEGRAVLVLFETGNVMSLWRVLEGRTRLLTYVTCGTPEEITTHLLELCEG